MNNEIITELTKEQLISKPKNQVFNIFMLHGITKVWLDPKGKDVQVPLYLTDKEALVLEFGYEMAKPIPDLTIGMFAIEATLSFNGEPFTCVIPWDCVLAITNQDGIGVYYGTNVEHEETIEETVKNEMKKKFTVLDGGKN
jgi:hypothetical protein